MVKVIGVSREEQERDDRNSKLVNLAKECFSNNEVSTIAGDIFVHDAHYKQKILAYVTPNNNQIDIYTSDFFNPAMKLGLAYECSGEKEWTVKKCYESEKYQ